MADAVSHPAAPTPVMDVVAPPVEKKPEPPTTEIDPLDKLVADDKKEQQATPAYADQHNHEKPAKQQAPATTKHADQTNSGVGAAITATVIIVLALAALATYAYIQTNK